MLQVTIEKKNPSALNNKKKKTSALIVLIYGETIIWVNERRWNILLRGNGYAPIKSNLIFLIDRLKRNWLEKLRWATGSLCTWQGYRYVLPKASLQTKGLSIVRTWWGIWERRVCSALTYQMTDVQWIRIFFYEKSSTKSYLKSHQVFYQLSWYKFVSRLVPLRCDIVVLPK